MREISAEKLTYVIAKAREMAGEAKGVGSTDRNGASR